MIFATNLEILEGAPAGLAILVETVHVNAFEVRGYDAEISFLNNSLPNLQRFEKPVIQNRIDSLEWERRGLSQ